MRAPILIATAVVAGGWLAACSKPASQSAQAGRQIQLAEPATPDSAVVSDLEAHQAARPILLRQAGHARIAPAPQARQSRVAAVAAEAPMPPMMNMTMSTVAEAPLAAGPSTAPEARAVGYGGSIGHGLGSFELPAPEPQSLGGGNRGPMILIRGGMGGIDDKCDTRGGHRGGIAVNRFGGSFRGGIR